MKRALNKLYEEDTTSSIIQEIELSRKLTSLYIEKHEIKTDIRDVYRHINDTKKRYDSYIAYLDEYIIFKIKKELDLFLYLLEIKNNNHVMLLKLILKIENGIFYGLKNKKLNLFP